MIKNERQLARTRQQLDLLMDALNEEPVVDDRVHPTIAEAARQAEMSQADDLRAEIEEYEALRDGTVPAPDLTLLGDLHRNLIRARVAKGMTQAELAKLVGVEPQQIQRYESTEYAGASLARLREIAAALGSPTTAISTGVISDETGLRRRLRTLGISQELVARLVRPSDRPDSFSKSATVVARALGTGTEDLLAPDLPSLATLAPAFKIASNASDASVVAYSAYAFNLAKIVSEAVALGTDPPSSSPDEVRDALVRASGEITFRALLEYCWDHGLAVLPLRDPGAFHAAFWSLNGTGVIVLKQSTRSSSRWTFDLAHEMCHAVDHISGRIPLPDGIVEQEVVAGWALDPNEQRANRFAGRVLLGRDAERLAKLAADRASLQANRLKSAVSQVASEEGVSEAALANYVAFRVAQEGLNWWGAASNLQDVGSDPWATARDVLLTKLDFDRIDDVATGLLIQALAE